MRAILRVAAPLLQNSTRRIALFSCRLADVGRDALDRIAGELRAGHPNFVYAPHRPPQVVQNAGRIPWGSGPPGEPPNYTGLDVIIVRDGKISALYVFLDSPPT